MAVAAALPAACIRTVLASKYVMAVDLGQSNDPTAIAVLHHLKTQEDYKFQPGVRVTETFDVVHLARLPLGLSYVDQVAEVRRLLARPPLSGTHKVGDFNGRPTVDRMNCDLVIDATGVGRAVADLFTAQYVDMTMVTITAGHEQTSVGLGRYHVPKSVLISMLDARLHTGALRFAAELEEAGAMREELRDFRRKVSVAGRYSFEARVGKHDDLVLSVALGLWMFVGRPKPAIAQSYYYNSV